MGSTAAASGASTISALLLNLLVLLELFRGENLFHLLVGIIADGLHFGSAIGLGECAVALKFLPLLVLLFQDCFDLGFLVRSQLQFFGQAGQLVFDPAAAIRI